jgi:hypothetical protein
MNKLNEVAKPNIDRLYTQLFSIKEMLSEVINTAQEAANDAGNFGGDISKVIPNQLRTQFVVGIQNFISQQGNPIAVDSMIQYLDSLPLSKVRVPRGEEAMAAAEPQMGMGVPAAPSGAMAGATMPMGSAIPPAPGGGMSESLKSAILKAQGQELLDETRRMWEEENPEEDYPEGTLDFKNIKEGYQRKPPTPEVFTKNNENKVYERAIKNAQAKPNKLQEADMFASPYVKSEVGDMSGWRDLVEQRNLDEEINERLGAAAVADAILSESGEGKVSQGIKRMKELVSPVDRGSDAGDIAALVTRGAFNEADLSDEIKPSRMVEAGGEDLTSLVLNDSRAMA